ncbi:unnamed protein product [Larinioides sclopetarius]|uniref:BTB domain-containing protein n=1 Tax=Larinioides sclopetarius TaxID=280406 RepID=A0AAV2AQM0_9ARAC
MDEIFLRRKADYLPQDILSVRCKIWEGEGNIVHNIGQSSARTRIKIEKNSFLHEVERFSALQSKVKQTIQIPSHSREQSFITSSLYLTEGLCCEKKIMIEIVPCDTNQFLCKCKLSLLYGSGNELEGGKADIRYHTEGKSIRILPLSITREEILNRKSEYLRDGKLTLLCECTFSSGLEFEAIEETVHRMPLPAVKQKSYRAPRKNICNGSENMSTYSSVSEDLKALYITKSLSDVQLKTKTKSFPAHKIILCARSSVFKRMMTSDMKEKNSGCIEIDDLDDDVVQQLLIFLYSDTIGIVQWEMATRLYYAADKYEVVKLKAVCSSFLLENLTPTNAGELLVLADTHSDGDLKKSVEDFILEYEEEVFGSDEWEKLMETNPVLIMKAMHLKYKRKKNEVK